MNIDRSSEVDNITFWHVVLVNQLIQAETASTSLTKMQFITFEREAKKNRFNKFAVLVSMVSLLTAPQKKSGSM